MKKINIVTVVVLIITTIINTITGVYAATLGQLGGVIWKLIFGSYTTDPPTGPQHGDELFFLLILMSIVPIIACIITIIGTISKIKKAPEKLNIIPALICITINIILLIIFPFAEYSLTHI